MNPSSCRKSCPNLLSCLANYRANQLTVFICRACQLVSHVGMRDPNDYAYSNWRVHHINALAKSYQTKKYPDLVAAYEAAKKTCPNASWVITVDKCINCRDRKPVREDYYKPIARGKRNAIS